MSYLNWFLCLFSILSEKTFVSSQNTRRDQIIFNYNNTYKYNVPYTVYVNRDIEYIMEFAGDSEAYETPARVNIASDFANRTYPLFVTARQQKGVFSWQLPMLVQTPVSLEQFTNISRTLCPHNNLFSEEEDTCDVSTLNTPIVHLTSASPDPIEATIVVETVTDFYIKLNSTTNLTSTPSQPKYYFFPFDQGPKLDVKSQSLKRKYNCNKHLDNSEQRLLDRYLISSTNFDQYGWLSRPKSVIVIIESEDEICAVVSIQNFSCPVFDNERDILYDGYYLTMTKRGGITLTQDTFPLGFYIVFIVKSSDEDCSDTTLNSTVPNYGRKYFTWDDQVVVASNEGRVKKFSFKIIQMISYQEYMIAAGAALAFFLCFYVGFINAVIRQIFKIIQTISYQEYMIAAGAALAFFLCFYVGFIIAVIWQRKTRRSNVMHESNRSEGTASTNVTVSTATTSAARRRRVDVHSSNRCLVDTDGRGDRSSSSDTESECSTHDDNIDNEMCINAGKLCVANLASADGHECSTHEDNIDNEMYINAGKLCVANLARCRPRVLSARSKMYLFNVLTVAVFYTLPVIQLVVTYQRLLNQSGNQDLCYFNFLCAHPLLVLSDFNHVYSNLGYVLLGALFLIAVWRRQAEYTRSGYEQKELGIPQHFGLLYAMGIALVSEGLLSAAYHVCPNSMNFQFDTSFMYVTSVLCMVKIYQSRHPDINARAHATFAVLALIIFIGLVGVLNANFYFWVAFTVLHLVTCLVMTFQIYYLGRFRLDGAILTRAARFLARQPLSAITPARVGRCAMLAIANLANWALAAYGVAQHSKDFASHLLLVLMSNLFLYTLFYIVMKLLHRESIRWYTWVYIFLTYTIWFSSSYFYLDQNTNWALTPAQSRQSNSVCSLLQLYDSHDIWHFMSSTAMFFSFNMYLTIDDNLADVPRSEIMVF